VGVRGELKGDRWEPERSERKKLLAPAQESNYTIFQIRPVSGLFV